MKKIAVAIMIILFALCIPNCSRSAKSLWDNNTNYPNKPEFKVPFCIGPTRQIENIYKAMRMYRDDWLESEPFGVNGAIWKYNAYPVGGNGLGNHMVWSTGGGCIGHGKQGSWWNDSDMGKGDGNRKIHVFDIDETWELRWQYLAYAMLYSTVHNEYSSVGSYFDNSQLGKQAIGNWLKRHETNLGTFKGQIDSKDVDDLDCWSITRNQKYDQTYGGFQIGETYYSSSVEYANACINGANITINQTQMNNDIKNDTPTKVFWRDGGNGYTVIGPYRLDIKRKSRKNNNDLY